MDNKARERARTRMAEIDNWLRREFTMDEILELQRLVTDKLIEKERARSGNPEAGVEYTAETKEEAFMLELIISGTNLAIPDSEKEIVIDHWDSVSEYVN